MRQLAGLFPATEYPDVLVGLGEPDDAAVIRIDDTRALIKTLDFFTPIVDDPWTFGAIAAVNAMSDVYAMGGDVVACLNIAGFPDDLPTETIVQIFAGGATKVREAGAAITGGHTVVNPEPFYGLSVTGWIDPGRIMRKGGARPGDRLFLTKPLGSGIIATAAKLTGKGESRTHRTARRMQGKPDLEVRHLDAAVISMLSLNRSASQAAQAANVRGATDITGFGLLGHGAEMAVASGKEAGAGLRIRSADHARPARRARVHRRRLSHTRGDAQPEGVRRTRSLRRRRPGAYSDAAVGGGDQRRAAGGRTRARSGPLPRGCAEAQACLLGDRRRDLRRGRGGGVGAALRT